LAPTHNQTYAVSSWLFARALGAVLLIAFVSLGVQAQGLYGANGVMPISMFVDAAKNAGHGFWQHPSALWWASGDGMITGVWAVGVVAAVALLVGWVPKVALAVSWFAYLSFVSLGWPFMSFQWDTLLLEVSFTAFFFVVVAAVSPRVPICLRQARERRSNLGRPERVDLPLLDTTPSDYPRVACEPAPRLGPEAVLRADVCN
jgi:hypothetical protein